MASANKVKSQSIGYYRYHDLILGKGNFATVYLARHKIIGCEVALKVINTDDIKDDYVIQNLEREAHILKDLHHPNIARLYETVKSVNLYCLSLELVRGVNLYQFMQKQESQRISERLARVFFYQILSAVEYIHHLHVIHRDLKLENILVEFGHVIKIVDFGLSNMYYPCFRLRTHCGSVEYAAPELFRTMSAYGLAVDLWSLGVILYAMVVGQMPFSFRRERMNSGETSRKREKFLQRISKGLMQENWELMEDLSPDCWNLLHDLLEPDQFRRIQIEGAINHHWITKDEHLKKRLPQKRRDLQRRFRCEIIEYLADLLNTSTVRIEKRINAGHYNNTIACMFYIIRDVLVKEVLHPPKQFYTSFLYRFEYWKEQRISLSTIRSSNKFERHRDSKERETKERLTLDRSLPASSFRSNETQLSLKRENEMKNTSKLYTPLDAGIEKPGFYNKEMAAQKASRSETDRHSVGQEVSRVPYKSYKNSRPVTRKEYTSANKQDAVELKHEVEKIPSSSLYQKFNETHERKLDNKAKNDGLSSVAASDSKTEESNKQTTDLIKRIRENLTPRETVSKRMEGTFTTLVPRETVSKRMEGTFTTLLTKEQPANGDKKITEEMKRTGLKKTPSKIPIKNMHYGPPAPFSQPVKTVKMKRTPVANRISLCKGDTNEKL